MTIFEPEPWIAELRAHLRPLREKLNKVDQILAVLGDDGNVRADESWEMATLLYEMIDHTKNGWQRAARLSAAAHAGELGRLEGSR